MAERDFDHLPFTPALRRFRQHWRDKAKEVTKNLPLPTKLIRNSQTQKNQNQKNKASPKRQHLQRYKAWLLPFWKLIVAVMVLGNW